ncbi:MAG: alpha/beta fold hydrolase [Armatimonadetes bacterium]|nr:alpha/beta fold hydrolase [Armatimonadota bacterium]
MKLRRVMLASVLCGLVIGCANRVPPGAAQAPGEPGQAPARGAAKPPADVPPKLGPGDQVKPAEPLKLEAADGVALDSGWRPTKSKAKAGVVLVPMLGHTREDYDGFSQALAGYGVASLAVSLRGHGKSAAPDGKSSDKFSTEDWTKAKADIAAAVAALREKVGGAPVAIVGASIGANLAVLYAADQPDRVQGLVLMSPGLDYHGVTITEAFGKLKTKPTMVINSADDTQAVPAAKLQVMHEEKKFTMLQYDGSEHGTDLLGKHAQIVSKVVDWLGKL